MSLSVVINVAPDSNEFVVNGVRFLPTREILVVDPESFANFVRHSAHVATLSTAAAKEISEHTI